MNFHLRLDISGALQNWKLKDFRKMFRHDDGRDMTAQEARAQLFEMLASGKRYLVYGECRNWDLVEQRCKGHESVPEGQVKVAALNVG